MNESQAAVAEQVPARTYQQFDPLPVGATQYMPVDEIVVDHDANSRKYTAAKIEEMALSLLDKGQLQPIRITSTTRRVVFGYRRVAGISYINESKMYKPKEHPALESQAVDKKVYVRCEVVPELSDEQMFLLNIAENDDREDTTPIDRANQMARLTKPVAEGGFGYTQAQCAEAMSKSKKVSQATVSKYLKVLAEAPGWAVKLVHDGKRPMENLIAAVGFPAGSKERDGALAAFKEGETAAAARAKVRKDAQDTSEADGGGDGKKGGGKVALSRAELIAAIEVWSFTEEGQQPTPFEEIFQQLLKFAAGKASNKKTVDYIAERVKARLAKAA